MPKDTTTPTTPPPAGIVGAPATRRGLVGSALAGVVLGGAAPFLVSDDPDAALLALCSTYEAAHARAVSRMGGKTTAEDDAFNRARGQEWAAFRAVAEAPPAATDVGRLAKAHVAVAMNAHHRPDDIGEDMDFCRNVMAEMIGQRPPPLSSRDHPDAQLLALCAEFETLQRAANGVWPWRIGRGVTVQGPNHIEDEKEQERVAEGFEAGTHDLQAQIFDIRSQTVDGMRAKARCLLLTSPEFRFLADDEYEEDSHNPVGLYFVTANLLASLLQDLNNGEVTRRNCMDARGTEVTS